MVRCFCGSFFIAWGPLKPLTIELHGGVWDCRGWKQGVCICLKRGGKMWWSWVGNESLPSRGGSVASRLQDP